MRWGRHLQRVKVRKAFTVSMATEDQVVPCDYVGIESGRKVPDKFNDCGMRNESKWKTR